MKGWTVETLNETVTAGQKKASRATLEDQMCAFAPDFDHRDRIFPIYKKEKGRRLAWPLAIGCAGYPTAQ
jgi:hypothetical protein